MWTSIFAYVWAWLHMNDCILVGEISEVGNFDEHGVIIFEMGGQDVGFGGGGLWGGDFSRDGSDFRGW